jgi:hypothetical protein
LSASTNWARGESGPEPSFSRFSAARRQRLHGRTSFSCCRWCAPKVSRRSVEAVAAAVAIEQIEQVQAGDAQVARHHRHRRTRGLAHRACRSVQPVLAPTLVETPTTLRSTLPARTGLPSSVPCRGTGLRVLAGAVVVEQQDAAGIVELTRLAAARAERSVMERRRQKLAVSSP